MAVDKSLSRAPQGLSLVPDPANDPDSDIEVSIEGEDGSEESPEPAQDSEFNKNLAEDLDEGTLAQIGSELLEDFDDDIASRKDWVQTYVDGLDLLGMKIEERTEPWPGACGVFHPLLAEALVKFQAETMMETFPAAGPVKTQILGKETPQKKDSASRVQADMNYQLTDRMVEYRPEHERMLWGLGLSGNAFKKVYYDPSLGRQVSIFVTAEDVVVPYGATSLYTAERVTHVMRKTKNELKRLQAAGFYCDADLGDPVDTFDEIEKKIAEKMGFRATSDDRYKLLEMQVELTFEEDEEDNDALAKPYIVTLEKASQKILAIRRNWQPDDKLFLKRNHFVHYPYIPGFGFYAFGLIHLIGSFAKSGTSLIRQLVDAGTLSNLPGGFKTKGLRVKGDDTPISPAEWRDVDVASGTMRDNIMPLPYKEPSQVLFTLLQNIVEEGRRLASAGDLNISDMSSESPVGTTLAILERTLKVMSAIQARIHYAMRLEFNLLRDIIRDYTPSSYSYQPEEGSARAKKSDYDDVAVLPVSDPNAATMAQKVVQYQAVLQLAQTAPQIYDLPYLHRQMLDVLGIKNISKLIPADDDEDRQPVDPVSENMAIINLKPVKAFIAQDHEAHIIVHSSAMQDPQVQQLIGQNPQAPIMMGAMQAHIAEHLAFAYRKRIEDAAGVPYPAPNAPLTPDLEVQISRLAAAAAAQVLKASQNQMASQQAAQAAQDPIVQLQQQELAIKQQEAQAKGAKIAVDAATAKDKIDIEKERIASAERIAGMNAGIKISSDKAQFAAKQQQENMRMSIDVARDASKEDHQEKELSARQQEAGMRMGVDVAREHAKNQLAARQADQQDALGHKQAELQHIQATHQTGVDYTNKHDAMDHEHELADQEEKIKYRLADKDAQNKLKLARLKPKAPVK